MEIKQTTKLHNRFEIKVVDIDSGEVKQSAEAYNVITDNYFKRMLGITSGGYPLYSIAIGTGTGSPSTGDTKLFSHLGRKKFTTVETHYEYPTSYAVYQIILNADEYVGSNITEVGLETYRNSSYYLATHAMLQDSEGEQIAIHKSDTDVVYINATFYCTFSQTGFGDRGIYPAASSNWLFKWILADSSTSQRIRIGRFALAKSSDLTWWYTGESDGYYYFTSGTPSFETLSYTMAPITIQVTELNNHVIKTIGFLGIGAFCFPDPSVFPDYDVEHLVVGEGDGVNTEFNVRSPLIKEGSMRVFVNNAELPPDSFTADYENNCIDSFENYHTAGMSCRSDYVKFGDMRSRAPSGNTRYDPLSYGYGMYDTQFYPTYCNVTAVTPIWFDFQTPKECNRLKILETTVPTAQTGNLVIEHSDDNEVWTAVTTTNDGRVWSFPPASGRYWRIYIRNYTWQYYLYDNTYKREEIYSGAKFFLGKCTPGLKLAVPPALGETVDISYKLDVPFKTENNIMRLNFTIQFQRG